jgi:acetyl esterase/lipase
MAQAALRRLSRQALLSLPTPVLRALAGGGVVWRGGRTLDPRLQYLTEASKAQAPLAGLAPADARAAYARALQPLAARKTPGVKIEPMTVEGAAGPLEARLFRPSRQDLSRPVILFAVGGVLDTLDQAEAFCSLLAHAARTAVLAVACRLAPEHRFPAGIDDLEAAHAWLAQNTPRFGAPLGQTAVAGAGLGANLAAVLCLRLKRGKAVQPALQLLLYPLTDWASETPSMADYADLWPLSRALVDSFAGYVMGPDVGPADPDLSPLRALDLSGLAPAIVVTAGFDPLADQGEAYALRLRRQGVTMTYRRYDSLAHGFIAYAGAAPAAQAACEDIARLIDDALSPAP